MKNQAPKTHTDIVALWPSLTEFARDLGVPYVTAQAMQTRRHINSKYWQILVDSAHRRGFAYVSFDLLVRTQTPGGVRARPRSKSRRQPKRKTRTKDQRQPAAAA